MDAPEGPTEMIYWNELCQKVELQSKRTATEKVLGTTGLSI